jgi:hypothetical protein
VRGSIEFVWFGDARRGSKGQVEKRIWDTSGEDSWVVIYEGRLRDISDIMKSGRLKRFSGS